MKNILMFAVGGLLFASCADKEYGYNEKASSIFLQEMENLDENHSAFVDTTVIYHFDEYSLHRYQSMADVTIKNANDDLLLLKELSPSEDAKPFHNGVVHYITGIADYGKLGKQIAESKDVNEQKVLLAKLENAYKNLSTKPDSILEIQRVYFEKVGMKAK